MLYNVENQRLEDKKQAALKKAQLLENLKEKEISRQNDKLIVYSDAKVLKGKITMIKRAGLVAATAALAFTVACGSDVVEEQVEKQPIQIEQSQQEAVTPVETSSERLIDQPRTYITTQEEANMMADELVKFYEETLGIVVPRDWVLSAFKVADFHSFEAFTRSLELTCTQMWEIINNYDSLNDAIDTNNGNYEWHRQIRSNEHTGLFSPVAPQNTEPLTQAMISVIDSYNEAIFNAIKSGDEVAIYNAITEALPKLERLAVGDMAITLSDGNRYTKEHLSIAGFEVFRQALRGTVTLSNQGWNMLSGSYFNFIDLTREQARALNNEDPEMGNLIGSIQHGLNLITDEQSAILIIGQLLEEIDATDQNLYFELTEPVRNELNQLLAYYQYHALIASINDQIDFRFNFSEMIKLLRAVTICIHPNQEDCEIFRQPEMDHQRSLGEYPNN